MTLQEIITFLQDKSDYCVDHCNPGDSCSCFEDAIADLEKIRDKK